MRLYNIAAVPVLASTLVMAQLSSCQQQTAIVLQDVDNIAQAICHFIPNLATVQAILGANPALTTATAVAEALCGLLPPAPATASNEATNTSDHQVAVVDYKGKKVEIVGHYDFQPLSHKHAPVN